MTTHHAAHQHAGPEHTGHEHAGHEHPDPPQNEDPVAFWEGFYGSDRRPWSGRPNAVLVEELAARPLSAASVLDLGCGSGADAVWFAEQGWRVTGVDISAAALTVAAAAAERAGTTDRISWIRADLVTAFPPGRWELVVASYLQSPVTFDRERVLQQAAAAVAPGGTLLVLGHERFPAWHQGAVTVLPTVADVLGTLDVGDWLVERAEPVPFAMTSPEGDAGERLDHIIRLRRR